MWLLNRNIRSNLCEHIKILKGNFLDQSKELLDNQIRFDGIYSNPPLKTGHKYLLELFERAFQLLSPHGIVQYVHKKSLGANGFLNKLKKLEPNWNYHIVRKVSGFFIILISPMALDLSEFEEYFA